MLEQEEVANRVVQATLRNEHQVILPAIYDVLLRLSGQVHALLKHGCKFRLLSVFFVFLQALPTESCPSDRRP